MTTFVRPTPLRLAITALAATAVALSGALAPGAAFAAGESSLSGVVTSEDGSPIANANVAVRVFTDPGWQLVENVSTDSDGFFEAANLDAGTYSLVYSASNSTHAWFPEFFGGAPASTTYSGGTEIELDGATPFTANNTLLRGSTIAGVIETGGEAISAGEVTVHDEDGVEHTADQSGETGFLIKGIRPGSYKLRFVGENNGVLLASEWHSNASTRASATAVVLEAEQDLLGVEPQLEPAASISGSAVSAAEGTVDVSLYSSDGEVIATERIIPSQEPEYEFDDLRAGTYRLGFAAVGEFAANVASEFYDNKGTLATATPISLAAGQQRSMPDVALSALKVFKVAPTPTIAGYVRVGSVLTAKPGTWASGVNLSYEWLVAGSVVATTPTYRPAVADLGKTIRVRVTATLKGYEPAVKLSPTTVPVAKGVITARSVTVTGTARVGNTLEASTGSWLPGSATLSYSWLRDGVAISGATSATYLLAPADRNREIAARVTGAAEGYSTRSATSAAIVAAPGILVPADIPVVTGDARVGGVLTLTTDPWEPAPVSLTYQWFAGGVAIEGATSTSLTVPGIAAGKTVTVKVIGNKLGYAAKGRFSVPTETIAKGVQVAGGPVTFTGDAVHGAKLTVSTSGWSSRSTLSYRWLRDGVSIPGATASTYTVGRSDRGHTIEVKLVATRTGYTTIVREGERAAEIPAVQFAVDYSSKDDYEGRSYYPVTGEPIKLGGGELLTFTGAPGQFDTLTDVGYSWHNGTYSRSGSGELSKVSVSDDGSKVTFAAPSSSKLSSMRTNSGSAGRMFIDVFTDDGRIRNFYAQVL